MRAFLSLVLLILVSCAKTDKKDTEAKELTVSEEKERHLPVIKLTLNQANNLVELPLACIQVAYPNKLNQTLGSKDDLGEPQQLHPAFYGCFDWHSSVHGHWSLVKLLKLFPNLENADSIKKKLLENISKENILRELHYFEGKHSKSYERTYGWAWLLKLDEEIYTWQDPIAEELTENLKPLTNLIVNRYLKFLPKLNYPIRTGEHPNTAFGLSFAWDYATAVGAVNLKTLIAKRSKEFYLLDKNCPLDWEPGGYDFLSPCFEEIDLMRKILDKTTFEDWILGFMPQLKARDFKISVGEVSDRSDGKLVHLDGLNFSRAWVFHGLANQYPEYKHLRKVANQHITYSLPNLVSDSYEGGHWLGSFAIYALGQAQGK